MSEIESRYPLFDSIEQMLAPESLCHLLSKPVTRVVCLPMNGHSGLAGGNLSYVDTDIGRFVLKRMSIESDWIMFSSHDTRCRAVRLWQHGLLDRLRPHIEHAIIACGHDGDGWAILMDDLTGKVYAWDKPVPPRLLLVFLDRLARLHATFWNDPLLNEARLGLNQPANLLHMLPAAQKHTGGQRGVIPDWIRGGWEVMEELLDAEVFRLISDLIENPLPLLGALSRYPQTLLHTDYRSENLAYLKPARPIVLDWQGAARSLMSIDLSWFITWVARGRLSQEQVTNHYRHHLEAYLKTAFDDADWQAMIELGLLVEAVRSTFFSAYWAKHSDTPEGRLWNEQVVKERNQQVRDGVRWL